MSIYLDDPVVLEARPGYRLLSLCGREFIDCREQSSAGMREYLYSSLNQILDDDTLDDYGHRYPVSFLVDYFSAFQNVLATLASNGENEGTVNPADAAELLSYLKKTYNKLETSFIERKKRGVIEMSDMPRFFPVGTEVIAHDGDEVVAGEIKSINIRHSLFLGTYYEIGLRVIHAIKGIPEEGVYTVKVTFTGIVAVDTLPIRIATEEDKVKLTERGRKYLKFCKPGTYASYTGNITQDSYWSTRIYRADGRVVIDPVSFERTQSETWREGIGRCNIRIQDERSRPQERREIKEADYWRCIGFMYGFSLSVKQWGRVSLEGLSDIQWRNNAFEQLVLDPEDKDLLYSLVKFHGSGFTDIIEGKGGGCIFLLHGEPGFGKTASAEAVAELLHKPLYSVSVGELGVDPNSLESSLRTILDVATIWDAVILLDEADIFLEERDEHDVARNAMVGVFLRLLEYHNGVLFLTTNRVEHFDRAFYSRISIALLYRKEEGKVLKIWHNLLGAAGLPQEWAKTVAGYDVNGRQVKNAIRMAQTLARAKDRKPLVEDLVRAIEAALRFQKEITKIKSLKAETAK